MKTYTKTTLSERLSTAANAKKALLDKFRARPAADDPDVVARGEARKAISEARETRTAEREAARAEEQAREAAERAREAAERVGRELAAQEQQAREAAETAEREAALEIERKAQRDARYAARKARK